MTESIAQRPGRPPGTSRSAVSRTALEMFADRGFEETTVDDIADALGVSRRTLFRYFASKNDMVWGDFDWVLGRLRRCLDATASDEPLHEALRRAAVESNRYEDEQLPELRIRMRLITGVPALQAHSALRYAEWREVIAEWVGERLARASRPISFPRRWRTRRSGRRWPRSWCGSTIPRAISWRTSSGRTGCSARGCATSHEGHRRLTGGGRLGSSARKSRAREHASQMPRPRADSSASRNAA